MDVIIAATGLVFQPHVLLVIGCASIFGLFMGAIPGLSATMATALLVPFTFFMSPVPALGAVIAASAMAIFAGDIPAALLRMPGTPSSAAYVEDLYAMTQRGRSERALGACLIFSALGGICGTIVLITTAPLLARVASNFSSFEYFWLACLGLTCAVIIFAETPVKGVISLLIGMMLATIGTDVTTGFARFSFGNSDLAGGISFIPALIGLFALSEIMKFAQSNTQGAAIPPQTRGELFTHFMELARAYWPNALRGGIVGTLVGVLPGAGGGVATWISYAVSLRFRSEKRLAGMRSANGEAVDQMGGVVEATAANNASLGGAWVPLLVFGIPGDAITAIVIGVLFLQGIVPGPRVFVQTPQLAYALFIVFLLSNVLLIPFGWMAIRFFNYIMQVPRAALMPVILILALVGAFAINNSAFDILVMTVLGVLAFIMEKNGFPIAPVVLGLVLAPIVEENLVVSLMKSRGDLLMFFERPLAAALGAITVLLWLMPLLSRIFRTLRPRAA